MCINCDKYQQRTGHGKCPMCRQPIVKIQKMFMVEQILKRHLNKLIQNDGKTLDKHLISYKKRV